MVDGVSKAEKPEGPSKAELRTSFNERLAPALAKQLALPPQETGSAKSTRFTYFADDERFAVIAGAQEEGDVELALAYGIRYAKGRHLTLVLPEGHTNATEQRVPWLKKASQPELFVHSSGGTPARRTLRSRRDTIAAFTDPRGTLGPSDDLGKALTPTHLGAATPGVWALVEKATTSPVLDHAHRQGERSWHCAGQRVLSIARNTSGVTIKAGIHYSGPKKPLTIDLSDGHALTADQCDTIWAAVEAACEQRLSSGSPAIHKPDEHWLQSVLRHQPNVVGIEQPAMREVPAWRPHDTSTRWGRGFLDLFGLDGHGNMRIVETKLTTNADDLLVLQGLDYFVWAHAYEAVLRSRLSAPKSASFELHYVMGVDPMKQKTKPSPCTAPLAAALDADAVPWRFQRVEHWYEPASSGRQITAQMSNLCELLPD
jgi:hypothetical protein